MDLGKHRSQRQHLKEPRPKKPSSTNASSAETVIATKRRKATAAADGVTVVVRIFCWTKREPAKGKGCGKRFPFRLSCPRVSWVVLSPTTPRLEDDDEEDDEEEEEEKDWWGALDEEETTAGVAAAEDPPGFVRSVLYGFDTRYDGAVSSEQKRE